MTQAVLEQAKREKYRYLPDRNMARRFLVIIDNEAETFTFQTFDDSPEKRRAMAKTIRGDLATAAPALERMNESGAGVFVTINETRGTGRKAKDVVRVRAVFADFDQGTPPLDEAPLPPTMVVESSPGKQHWYWAVEGLPLEQFKPVQKAIAERLNSDPAVCDLPRVMRLPGFWHRKSDPCKVKLLHATERVYKAEEILTAFAIPVVQKKTAQDVISVPEKKADSQGDAQAEHILKTSLGAIADAPEGERNNTLNREAFKLYGLVKANRLARARVDEALERTATACGLPSSESRQTMNSAWEAAKAQPLSIKVDGMQWQQPPESGTEIRQEPPGEDARPRWCCYLKPNPEAGIRRAGVWFHGLKQRKPDELPELVDEWLCSPLLVEALTRTPEGGDYGRLLRYRVEGRWRTWNMPMKMLAGDPAELRRELLAAGVEMDNRNPRRLFDYLTAMTPRRKIHAALELGWHGSAFVLPDTVFGGGDIYFQSESALVADYAAAGSLKAWQQRIARLAVGNKPLVFAISAAMAGPLLHKLHLQGGGFHFVGGSSCGKTTSLQAAASVWGPPPLVRNWRATANGLEAAAAEANDLVLVLDEIGECTPKEVGRVVYALGNGTGKSRATQKGYARRVRRWRTVLLSSGERTLSSVLHEAGERVTAGQEVRLLSLPADGFTHGVFDNLHNHTTGAHFANAIKTACSEEYGTAGRAWLDWLTAHQDEAFADQLRMLMAKLEHDNGQEARAAQVFAMVMLAGMKAVAAGILPWPEQEPVSAVLEMWERWKAQRGQGPAELRQVVESLASFIARHEDRFVNLDNPTALRTINDRAGYIKDGHFHFIPGVFKEAIEGIDAALAKRLLFDAGFLIPENGKRFVRNLWIGGGHTRRVVSVRARILSGEI